MKLNDSEDLCRRTFLLSILKSKIRQGPANETPKNWGNSTNTFSKKCRTSSTTHASIRAAKSSCLCFRREQRPKYLSPAEKSTQSVLQVSEESCLCISLREFTFADGVTENNQSTTKTRMQEDKKVRIDLK